jgi:hypothetical protein
VLSETDDIANVAEFDAGMLNGLLNVSVLVSVILRTTFVAFRNVQKFPPSVVDVVAGKMIELKDVLVM